MKQHTSFISLVFIVLSLSFFTCKKVTFDNLKPRYDINGQIIDAHDGTLQKFTKGGPYYYHAMQYGLYPEPARYGCDSSPDHAGFRLDHNISIYASFDLSSGSWRYVGNSIEIKDRPAGIVYRPHVVYNPNSNRFVLWWNYFNASGHWYAAAVSDRPEGPFELSEAAVNVTRLNETGDFSLFVDDDGKGYVIYVRICGEMLIEELTLDMVHSTGKSSPIFPTPIVEAPMMFKRNRIYYALFGHCCCFCEQGSGIFVYTSRNPLGPYVLQQGGNIACASNESRVFGIPSPFQGCQYDNPATTSVTRSQQNFVAVVDTADGVEYIYTGDRWQQAPDGIKGHDPQYWMPLRFRDDGTIEHLFWVDRFVLDVL